MNATSLLFLGYTVGYSKQRIDKNTININNLKQKNGAPERIRTSDRSVRSRVLYPAELRARYTLFRPMPYKGGVS